MIIEITKSKHADLQPGMKSLSACNFGKYIKARFEVTDFLTKKSKLIDVALESNEYKIIEE